MANSVSLITTVKNERETIRILLNSVINQTKSPDEFIIVDGGSSDGTIDIIRSYKDKLPIKVIVSRGSNIAKGRNIAIKNSQHEIIACTDGGCKLDPNWLRNIVKPFEELDVDVVSGVYAPWYESEYEEIASYLLFPDIEKLDTNKFLPSGRSIAFNKEAWKAVEGYPEWLYTAEDTLFDLKLKRAGMKFALARDAIVYWRIRKNNKEIFKQFYNYAKGDGMALLFPQLYLARYAVALMFLLLATNFWHSILFWFFINLSVFAVLWIKHLKKVRKPSLKRLLKSLLIAVTIEVGLILGYPIGIKTRIKKSLLVMQQQTFGGV